MKSEFTKNTENKTRVGPLGSIFKSPHGKIVILLIVSIIAVFLLMLFTYRKEIDRFLVEIQSRQLRQFSDHLYDQLDTKINHKNAAEADLHIDLERLSVGMEAYVWLVAPDGTLLYKTGLPAGVDALLRSDEAADLQLPEIYSGVGSPREGYLYSGGNYFGLFADDGNVWLSYVRPLFDTQGRLIYILQVHKPYDKAAERGNIFFNGLGFSLILSFVVTVIFVILASYHLNRPLKILSEAAERVARGDLSARVPERDYDDADDPFFWMKDDLSVLNHTFNDMVERLEHLNSDRRDMMIGLSHDLRTPLTSITGFVGGMLDGTIPPEKHPKYLEIVKKESKRLSKMVDQMHEMGLMESSAIRYNIKPLDICELIRHVLIGMEPQLAAKHITVQTNFSEEMPLKRMVLGDADQLERVLVNLISNAVKFTPEGGVIAVSTSFMKHTEYVTVTVEDNGIGLTEQDINSVFNRFYKGDRSRTGDAGSGLGLYIAKSIIGAHGQRIWAGNSKMGGARFSFTLQTA